MFLAPGIDQRAVFAGFEERSGFWWADLEFGPCRLRGLPALKDFRFRILAGRNEELRSAGDTAVLQAGMFFPGLDHRCADWAGDLHLAVRSVVDPNGSVFKE